MYMSILGPHNIISCVARVYEWTYDTLAHTHTHTPLLLSVELFLHAFFCKQNSCDILSRMAWTDNKLLKLFRREFQLSANTNIYIYRCIYVEYIYTNTRSVSKNESGPKKV